MDYLAIAKALIADAGNPPVSILSPGDPRGGVTNYDQATGQHWVETPYPSTMIALSTLAHELGHVVTTQPAEFGGPDVDTEMRATAWGLDALERHNVHIPPHVIHFQQAALASYLRDPAVPRSIDGIWRKFIETGKWK